jgi:transposase InsO family protein
MLWVEPLGRKSEVLSAPQRFEALVEKESGASIKRLRCNTGGEYTSNAFLAYLKEHGIHQELATLYSLQSNGVAERVDQSIVEGILSFLTQSGAPKFLCVEAAHAALGGKVPLSVLDMLRT